MQSLDASDAVYFPAPQIRQSTSASWLVDVVASSERYVPAGHAVQVLEVATAVYVPAPQTTQPAPPEKYPAGHKEQEFEEKHEEPAEQETVQVKEQALAADAPNAVLYLPAAQIIQSATSL